MCKERKIEMYLKNVIKHFGLITHHKWVVFKLCCKIGEPWRGLVHDMSKYSPTEFIESSKYYTGKHSPISEAKRENGYSKAWLHHKGRNKHHSEYWIDENAPDKILREKAPDNSLLDSLHYDNTSPRDSDGNELLYDNKKHDLNSAQYQHHEEMRKKNSK